MAYIGKSPEYDAVTTSYEFTAVQDQTDFIVDHGSSSEVFVNGLKISDTEYSYFDATTIRLVSGLNAGDIVVVMANTPFYSDGHYSKIELDAGQLDNRYYTEAEVDAAVSTKQDTLVSGTNIKTISGTSLLGSGDLTIGGVPSGCILMWSGTIATIPSGWYLCDGNNGTPNLADTFIYGTSTEAEVGTTGGSADAVAVSHTHTGSSSTHSGHTHPVRTTTYIASYLANRSYLGDVRTWASYTYTATAGADTSGSHSHTLTIDGAGESGTNKNLPPYIKLAYIMKG